MLIQQHVHLYFELSIVFLIMAAGSGNLSEETAALSAASLWKGENDSDVEQMETYDSNPLE